MRLIKHTLFFLILYFVPNISSAQSVFLSGTYTDSLPPSPTCTYHISGDVTLKGSLHLNGLKFLCKSEVRREKNLPPRVLGANIRLCNANVTLENCTFLSADSGMWGGIYLADSSSQIRFSESKLQDSYHGIVQTDNSQIVAKNSEFRDNYVSLQLAGNRDTVQHCMFTSKPSCMKMPFDSVAATDYYYSWAHIKNAEKKEIYLSDKCLFFNAFHGAVYGILANEKHIIQVQGNYFAEHKLAAIFHQNGDLQLTDTNEIHLPRKYANTWQIRKAHKTTHLNYEDSLQKPVFGIFAEGRCNDVIGENNSFISQNNVANDQQMKFNHVAYHGQNDINLDFRLGEVNVFPNFVYGMQTGISLINHAIAQVNASTFVDNQTAIRVEKTNEGSIPFDMRCNSFVKTSAMKQLQCVGLQVDGKGAMNNIGGCSDFLDNPAGNEVVNELGISAVTAIRDSPSVYPKNFQFIRNNTDNIFQYVRYENEFVEYSRNVLIISCVKAENQGSSCPPMNRLDLRKQNKSLIVNRFDIDNQHHKVQYSLLPTVQHAMLVVRNYLGLEVHKQTLATNENSVSLLTGDWKTGLYSYSLVVDGRLVKTLKMVVGQ